MSGFRAQSDQQALRDELRELARRGFSQPDLVELEQFPAILAVAKLAASDVGSRATALHSLLTGAIAQLSPADQDAVALLAGLDPRAAGKGLRERRRLSAESLGVAAETFRTHRETKLMEHLANALLVHVANESPTRPAAQEDPGRVFLIHGRNEPARRALTAFLRSLGVIPIEWTNLIAAGDSWRAQMLDVLRSALETSSAVIALLAPESPGADDASPNVLLELGVALGLAPTKTVVVTAGPVHIPSDLAGLHVIHLSNATTGRDALRTRLRLLGCRVAEHNLDWLDPAVAGDFDLAASLPARTESTNREALDDLVGDRYELVQPFSTGFSRRQTWAARDRATDEHVALTIWPTDSPSTQTAIRKSALELAELDHAGLTRIRDVLAHDDHVIVASDVVDGVPLDSAGRLSTRAALKVIIGVLDALSALHSCGYVHADLKPANILIARGGQPVLIDIDALGPHEHRSAQPIESADEKETAPPAAPDDVRAAARLLLTMLAASAGVEGHVSSDEAIDLLETSPDLKQALRRALAADPAERPSADEMRRTLSSTREAAGLVTGT
jgi:predicted nucleotide-binding protein